MKLLGLCFFWFAICLVSVVAGFEHTTQMYRLMPLWTGSRLLQMAGAAGLGLIRALAILCLPAILHLIYAKK